MKTRICPECGSQGYVDVELDEETIFHSHNNWVAGHDPECREDRHRNAQYVLVSQMLREYPPSMRGSLSRPSDVARARPRSIP